MNVLHPAGCEVCCRREGVEGIEGVVGDHELFGEFRVGGKVLGLVHVRVVKTRPGLSRVIFSGGPAHLGVHMI